MKKKTIARLDYQCVCPFFFFYPFFLFLNFLPLLLLLLLLLHRASVFSLPLFLRPSPFPYSLHLKCAERAWRDTAHRITRVPGMLPAIIVGARSPALVCFPIKLFFSSFLLFRFRFSLSRTATSGFTFASALFP